jgi:membrane protease YdiL (CAAX protease family)
MDAGVELDVPPPPPATTTYALDAWPPDARRQLGDLVRAHGIVAPRWVGDSLTVAVADRPVVDDLIAYLNGGAAPGQTAGRVGPWDFTVGPAPAWHLNPEDPGTWRWWDGHRWTAFTVPAPAAPRPWFPPARADRSAAMRGGWIALLGFVIAELLSVGAAFLAIELGAEERSVVTLAVGGIAFWAGLLGACWLAVRRHGTGSLRDLGLSGIRRSDVGIGIVSSIVARLVGATAVFAWILVLPDETYGNTTSLVDRGRPSVAAMLVVGLIVVVGAPFFEELFFRGLVQGVLLGRIGARGAVLVQAGLFASVHYQVGMSLANMAVTFTAIGIAGVVLGVVRWHTGRLGAGMVSHAAFNLVAVVVTFLVL